MGSLQISDCTKTSLAVRAFQLSIAAAQEHPPRSDWDYLEHIEAPQWVDLSLEAALEGTEGDDPWFYQHHPHHETPLEDLVFTPEKTKPDLNVQFESPVGESECTSSKYEIDVDFRKQGDENAQVCSESKPKRVRPLPDKSRTECVKQAPKSENFVSLRPSDSFSAKLLSTLMARLRMSEKMQQTSSLDIGNISPLSDQETCLDLDKQQVRPIGTSSRKQMVKATVPLSETRENGNKMEKSSSDDLDLAKGNKEKSSTHSKEKLTLSPQLNKTKKPKIMNSRKSVATFEFNKAAFNVGRNDVAIFARRRLSCSSRSPRLKKSYEAKMGKHLHASNDRRHFAVRTSSDTRQAKSSKPSNMNAGVRDKSRASGAGGDHLAGLIANHTSKLQLKPKYEPRLHSTRDIREWERRTGQQYYSLQPIERVKVNQEITDFKRSRIP